MRSRWNGWGEESTTYELPESAIKYLQKLIGQGKVPKDVALETIVEKVPQSKLPSHPLISTDPKERVFHSFGQSLGDWIGIRSGNVPFFPDGIAYPMSTTGVEEVMKLAKEWNAIIIPYGGGTSVAGHINVIGTSRPVITMNMRRMNKLLSMSKEDMLATFQAGVKGPELEAALQAQGYTLGHFPQSFEYSTLGGWIVTKSSGQFSRGYGRIEQLFAGGKVVTPEGTIEMPSFPASGAGTDLREIVLGSEGRIGIVAEASVRISPLPEKEMFYGAFFGSEKEAIACAQQLGQSRLPLTMIRVSLAVETETMLKLNGDSFTNDLLFKYLKVRGITKQKCLLIYGAVGDTKLTKFTMNEASNLVKRNKGVVIGSVPGKKWYEKRFETPYLRNTLWEMGYAIDTLETATQWEYVPKTVEAIESALKGGVESQEKIHVFTHLSHVYASGSSIYTTYLFKLKECPEETMATWMRLKMLASEAIVASGGTISHQHGVGTDHLPYVKAEKGEQGLKVIKSFIQSCDPEKMMNPGKFIACEEIK